MSFCLLGADESLPAMFNPTHINQAEAGKGSLGWDVFLTSRPGSTPGTLQPEQSPSDGAAMLSLSKHQVKPLGFALSQHNVSVLQGDADLSEGMTLTLQKANNTRHAFTSHGKRGVSKWGCSWGRSPQSTPIYLQQLHGVPSASASMLTAEPLGIFP